MNSPVLMKIKDWKTSHLIDNEVILVIDINTMDIHYCNMQYRKQIEAELQNQLNLDNLSMCVILDNLNKYIG
jgi:hypothetical protein